MSVRLAVAVAVLGGVLGGTGLSGISSGGDPYFPLDGNQGYDVRHYRVANTYRPETDRLVGTTVLQARATEELTRFSLDLVLPVDRVLVDGRPAVFDKPRRHELHVTPAQPVRAGHSFTVEVRYHGRPSALEAAGVGPGHDLYFHTPGETAAMGEPQNGAWWFAANETPQDKATFDIIIRVPRGTEAVSNGVLVSRDVVRGWNRWHWRLEEPVATYLVFFAAGDFRIERASAAESAAGLPSVLAVSRMLPVDEQRAALRRLRRTDDTVAWLEGVLGDYPYGQTGGVITAIPAGYALETATRPVYPWSWSQGGGWRGLLVHEQAHQWFGNDVTVRRWRDVWLNEGFATYAEWWYDEDHGGRTVAERLARTYDAIPADRPFWEVQVGDPGPARMWSEAVYVRGAMTLAALRNRIGDTDFATVVTEWLDRHGGGHGTGSEFRALAEEVSGEDLGGFFVHWLDDTVKPDATAENGLG